MSPHPCTNILNGFLPQERGEEKERKLLSEILQKQWEEERARIPKANPYPYTTDYPVVCFHFLVDL